MLTRKTKPGTLVGTDQQYYNIAYPNNVIVYGVFPVEVPNEREVAGMRLSTTINCVAEQVLEHFRSSRRGMKLTDKRLTTINKWNDNIIKKNTGATKKMLKC